MTFVSKVANMLNNREQPILSATSSLAGFLEDAHLQSGRDMMVLDHKNIFKIYMFFFLDQSVSVNESLQINHENVW